MSDIAPYLGKLMLMGSSLNNAAMMSADDFFTMKCYQGDIYKSVNLQDRLLSNYCTDDSAMVREQKRIEKQLVDVQEHIYGRDSLYYAKLRADSIAQAEADSIAAAGKATHRRTTARRTSTPSRRTSSRTTKVSAAKTKVTKTKAPKQKATRARSASGGLSVRRQRH